VGVVLGLVVLVLVRDLPPGSPPRTVKSVRAVGRDLKASWRDPGTRLGMWSHFTAQFGANTMGLLWGYPFFVQGENTGQGIAGLLLSVLVLTQMLGGPLVGWFIAHNPWQRSTVVLAIVGAMAGTWGVVLLWPGDAPVALLVVLVVAVGLGGPGSMVGFDVARTFNPPHAWARPPGSSTSAASWRRCSWSSRSGWSSTCRRRAVRPRTRRRRSRWRCRCSTSAGWSARR
jgi:MFS family permease